VAFKIYELTYVEIPTYEELLLVL